MAMAVDTGRGYAAPDTPDEGGILATVGALIERAREGVRSPLKGRSAGPMAAGAAALFLAVAGPAMTASSESSSPEDRLLRHLQGQTFGENHPALATLSATGPEFESIAAYVEAGGKQVSVGGMTYAIVEFNNGTCAVVRLNAQGEVQAAASAPSKNAALHRLDQLVLEQTDEAAATVREGV